jgi:hypothetical protein
MRMVLFVALCSLPPAVLAADPVVGTWKLDVEKSTYTPGPAPKSQTRIYETDGEGIRVTIKTFMPDGQSSSVRHPVNYDGKEYPISGSSQSNAIILQRIDDYTSEATLKHASKVIGRTRRVVAKDGKTMTITYEGVDDRGRTVSNRAVYEKQ